MEILEGPKTLIDLESPTNKKKSGVKFKELVERIEVITEDEKREPSGDPQSDDDENQNERL